MKRLFILYLLLPLLLFAGQAWGATYNWYFSNAGNDTTGDGTEGTPWATAAKAQTQIHATSTDDVVNVFWNRGDTFSVLYADLGQMAFNLTKTRGKVVMDAYGAEEDPKPIFDGGMDWPNQTVSPGTSTHLNAVIKITKDDCEFRNLQFQNLPYDVFILDAGYGTWEETGLDGLTIEDCDASNLGYGFVTGGYNRTISSNVTVQRCEVGYSNYIFKNELCSNCWRSAIGSGGTSGLINDMIIDECYIHHAGGEGIHISGVRTTVSNCMVVFSISVGIYICPQYQTPTGTHTVKNNIVAQGIDEWSRNAGTVCAADGIVIRDEKTTGDNRQCIVNIHGNVVIGAKRGIGLDVIDENGLDITNTQTFEEVNIYNNTLIDNSWNFLYYAWYRYNSGYTKFADTVRIINNTSSINNTSTLAHVETWGTATYPGSWTIGPNHWHTSTDPGNESIPTAWVHEDDINGDPQITLNYGSGGWRLIEAADEFNFDDFYPPSGSPLVDAGLNLDAYKDADGDGFNVSFLTEDSDWHTLPSAGVFNTASQSDAGTDWDMGAVIYSGDMADIPTGCNDISMDANCVFWYEFSNNGNDSNVIKGSDPGTTGYNLSSGNSPAFAGAACAEGTDTGLVTLADGDNDYLYTAAFDQLTGDVSGFFVGSVADLADGEGCHFGQWEAGDDEKTWIIYFMNDGGDYKVKFYIGHNDGDGADGDGMVALTAQSEAADYVLTAGTVYKVVGRYDNSEDDAYIEVYNSSGTKLAENSDTSFLDANTQYTGSAVELGINAYYNSGSAAGQNSTMVVYEAAMWNSFLDSDDSAALATGEYGSPVAAPTGLTMAGNVTTEGLWPVYLAFNRNIAPAINGTPSIPIVMDYPNLNPFNTITCYYSSVSGNTATFYCPGNSGYRQNSIGDAQVGDDISLNDATWEDLTGENVTITSALAGLATYPSTAGHTVAIPFLTTDKLTVGTGGTFPDLQTAGDAAWNWIDDDCIDLQGETHTLTGEFNAEGAAITLYDGAIDGGQDVTGAAENVWFKN